MGHKGLSGVYWGAGRDSRYAGARKGYRALGAPMGCRGPFGVSGVVGGVRGVLGAGRNSRYARTRRGI